MHAYPENIEDFRKVQQWINSGLPQSSFEAIQFKKCVVAVYTNLFKNLESLFIPTRMMRKYWKEQQKQHVLKVQT